MEEAFFINEALNDMKGRSLNLPEVRWLVARCYGNAPLRVEQAKLPWVNERRLVEFRARTSHPCPTHCRAGYLGIWAKESQMQPLACQYVMDVVFVVVVVVVVVGVAVDRALEQ